MSANVEGTLVMDGLIEAHLPDDPQFEAKIRDWIKLAKSMGISFSLEMDGRTFNLLPLEEPVESARIGVNPSETITELLSQLLSVLPKALRGKVVSTLSSEEFKNARAIQTVFLVSGGQIEADQRTVDALTTPAEKPLDRKERAKLIGIGIGVAVVLFLLSSVFIDYRELVAQTLEQVSPINSKEIKFEVDSFKGYFSIKSVSVPRSQRYLEVLLVKGKRFPSKGNASGSLEANADYEAKLALEAISKGYVRCEYFDKKGKFMWYSIVRIKELRMKKSITLKLPVSRKRRPGKVVFTY